MTPKGLLLHLPVERCSAGTGSVLCSVIKDSGDDPDITHGMEVCAEVTLTAEDIVIEGGEGIGRVTKPGLDQPVGAAAINSVPRMMIIQAVKEAAELYDYSGGFHIVISVPGGEDVAQKTFNPRIGIVGGISIIGTTGIVEPMSDRAVIETIRTEASVRREEGRKVLILTLGNYSEKHIFENAPALAEQCVMCSNFIGDAIDIGISLGFEDILVYGHIGKMVKLGSGIMNTHSSYADGRMETLIACGALTGVRTEVLRSLADCATTDAALDILYAADCAEAVMKVLTERIDSYLRARAKGAARTGAVIFSFKHDLLLKTGYADDITGKAVM